MKEQESAEPNALCSRVNLQQDITRNRGLKDGKRDRYAITGKVISLLVRAYRPAEYQTPFKEQHAGLACNWLCASCCGSWDI